MLLGEIFDRPESVLAGGKTRDCKILMSQNFHWPGSVLAGGKTRDCKILMSQNFHWPGFVLAGGKTRDCKMLMSKNFDRPEFFLAEVAARHCKMLLGPNSFKSAVAPVDDRDALRDAITKPSLATPPIFAKPMCSGHAVCHYGKVTLAHINFQHWQLFTTRSSK